MKSIPEEIVFEIILYYTDKQEELLNFVLLSKKFLKLLKIKYLTKSMITKIDLKYTLGVLNLNYNFNNLKFIVPSYKRTPHSAHADRNRSIGSRTKANH